MPTRIDITNKVYSDPMAIRWDYKGYGVEFSCWRGIEESYRSIIRQPFCENTIGDHTFFFMLRGDIHDIVSLYDPAYTLSYVHATISTPGVVELIVDDAVAMAIKLSI